ncbi:MAG: ASPIC/UnbV domain-containing protein [Planctomycetes bacterium]|nr:ASPIC/UnbV domain-containing protein [Planctomycetota bacterium]
MVTHQDEFERGTRKFNMGNKSLNGYEINKLWRNEDGRHFTDVSVASGAGDVHDARGYSACDFDRDGDLDLVIRNYHMDSVMLRNEGVKGHWLEVRPRGTRTNRDGIGARVEIEAGGKKQVRIISAGSGYLMQQPNEAYFGLGDATRVDQLTVTWSNGTVQKFGPVDADRLVKLVEGKDGIEVLESFKQPVLAPIDLGKGDPLLDALVAADIKDLAGNKVDVSKLGDASLLVFWATWCNICRAEFPDIDSMCTTQANAGLKVAAITVMDPQGPPLDKSLAELNPKFPVYTMSRADYDRIFGKEAGVPRTLLVDHGRVSGVFPGKLRPYLVKSYIIEALRAR